MRSATVRAALAAAALLGSPACTTYLEKPTPPGDVPPPQGTATVPPPAADRPADPAPVPPPAAASPAPARAAASAPSPTTFAEAYQRMGSPRMIVYGVRRYSDRISDVQAGDRVESQYQRDETRTTTRSPRKATVTYEEVQPDGTAVRDTQELSGSSKTTKKRQVTEKESVGVVRAKDEETAAPDEDGLLFERSFTSYLVEQRVQVVDRDVLLRKEAQGRQGADVMKQVVLSPTVIEDYALKNAVDIIVSIDMLDTDAACPRRRYAVTAKSLKTGQILATANAERLTKTLVVTTRDGYERTTEPYTSCTELAGAVARRLLDALVPTAGRTSG